MTESIKEFHVNTSISDGFDRLTILKVKQKKLKDEKKLLEIKKEKELLEKKLEVYFNDTTNYYYRILFLVNEKIWDLLEEAKYNSSNNDIELKNYRAQEDYNERRFRIKKKIDTFLNSDIKEQKGYKKKKAFVLGHLGLGDHGYLNSMYRYIATIYDETYVVCKQSYSKNIEYFFKDDTSIIPYPCKDDMSDICIHHGCSEADFKKKTEGMDIFLSGSHLALSNRIYDYPYSFFDDVKLPRNIFWDYAYFNAIPNDLYKLINGQKYIFIHNTSSNYPNGVYSIEQVEKHFQISKNNVLFVNPCINIYSENHSFYHLANKFLGYKLSELIELIEKADYVSLSDSSFLGMAFHLNIKTDKCIYIPRGGRNYDYIYNEQNKSNILSNKMGKFIKQLWHTE